MTIVALVRLVCELQNACLEAEIRPMDEYRRDELEAMQAGRDGFLGRGVED
jgi:hypothetical protein